MKMLKECVIFLIVCNMVNNCFTTPCIVKYRQTSSNIYGNFEVEIPGDFKTRLDVTLNFEVELAADEEFLRRVTFKPAIENEYYARESICSNRVLEYTVIFPRLYNSRVAITSITVNGRPICTGDSIPLADSVVSRLLLAHSIDIRRDCFLTTPNNRKVMKSKLELPSKWQDDDINRNMSDLQISSPTTGIPHLQRTYHNKLCWNPTNDCIPSVGIIAYNKTEHPWLGALFIRSEYQTLFLCEASLISTKHAITAAHCVLSCDQLYLILGRSNLNNWLGGGQVIKVAACLRHPDYKNYYADGDIAILYLSKQIECTPEVQPICPWRGDNAIDGLVGRRGEVVGWGTNEKKELSNHPQGLTMPIVNLEHCLFSNKRLPLIKSNSRTFCAGFRNGSGPGKGGSGSGFYLQENKIWTIRGFALQAINDGDENPDQNNFIVFADVAQFKGWISESTDAELNLF